MVNINFFKCIKLHSIFSLNFSSPTSSSSTKFPFSSAPSSSSSSPSTSSPPISSVSPTPPAWSPVLRPGWSGLSAEVPGLSAAGGTPTSAVPPNTAVN